MFKRLLDFIHTKKVPVRISPIIASSESCDLAYNGEGDYTAYFKKPFPQDKIINVPFKCDNTPKVSIKFDGSEGIEKYRQDLLREKANE